QHCANEARNGDRANQFSATSIFDAGTRRRGFYLALRCSKQHWSHCLLANVFRTVEWRNDAKTYFIYGCGGLATAESELSRTATLAESPTRRVTKRNWRAPRKNCR